MLLKTPFQRFDFSWLFPRLSHRFGFQMCHSTLLCPCAPHLLHMPSKNLLLPA